MFLSVAMVLQLLLVKKGRLLITLRVRHADNLRNKFVHELKLFVRLDFLTDSSRITLHIE